MKKLVLLSITIMFLIQGQGFAGEKVTKKQGNDTLPYITITGKIIDQVSKSPVVFASIFVTGSSIGTVSNSDGEFVLKVPEKSAGGSITISYLGYRNKTIAVNELKPEGNSIAIETHAILLEEVIVKPIDALDLVTKAVAKIKENYKQTPEMQTGFYRETIKQNRSYVVISEAVLDIYNSGYREAFDMDRVKIYKGRKSKDVKKMDTILVKFQGGPLSALYLDVVKNPNVILDPEVFQYYSYAIEGIVSINNRNNYVVAFDQLNKIEYPLYSGNIYIDVESTSITGLDFRISDLGLPDASKELVKKKPISMKMDVLSGNYLTKYRMIDNKWILNYVRSEVVFKAKWDKKLFKSNITAMFEMAITDRDTENIEKFSAKEAVKMTDVLADKVEAFEDPDFWGEYNYIKPDESIQVAIEKLNKKLKRQ